MIRKTAIGFITALLLSCGSGTQAGRPSVAEPVAAPNAFSADSAMEHIRTQLSYGPRVPGTEAHNLCRQYITDKLNALGADTIITQSASVTAYDGSVLPMHNIIARFNSRTSGRTLLAAHYDTRPIADHDPDTNLRGIPIPGANDGASGVAVILELMRALREAGSNASIDVIFFDTEDYGAPEDYPADGGWCLGSQYWAGHPVPYTDGRLPDCGILLDMVGGRDARFYPEAYSNAYAPGVQQKIQQAARAAGAGAFFPSGEGGAVMDDHIHMLSAGIPTIDIIDARHAATGSFPPQWHTHADDIDAISPQTLQAVGNTLIKFIENEHPGN